MSMKEIMDVYRVLGISTQEERNKFKFYEQQEPHYLSTTLSDNADHVVENGVEVDAELERNFN